VAARPPKPCKKAGCPNITREPNGFCAEHQGIAIELETLRKNRGDDRRGSAASRGYGYAWTKVRARQLKFNPLCKGCLDSGLVTQAAVVHHKDEDQHNNDSDNLVSLCFDCHEKLHGRKIK
jgi:5-methylcytosine-specific restriction protein A